MFIHGVTIKNFIKEEFPEDPLFADPKLLIALDYLRDFIGYPIMPSPVSGALARFNGSKTSRHYAQGRLSTACDIFINADSFESYSKILQSGLFKGIGCYFDTKYGGKPHTMFHLDLRPKPLIWYRNLGSYTYEYENLFHKKLGKLLTNRNQ